MIRSDSMPPFSPFWRRAPSGLGRRVVAWWLLLALFLQLGAFAAGPAAADTGIPGGFQVCTVGGMVMVADGNGQPTPTAPTDHAQFCVFCLPLLHGGVQAVPDAAMPVPAAMAPPSDAPAFTATDIVAPQPLAGAASPQAPPRA